MNRQKKSVVAINKPLKKRFILGFFLVLGLFGFSGCQPSTQVLEADIVVADPTSKTVDWKDARKSILNHIDNAFGKTPIQGGGTVGQGTDGYVVVLPVGSYTDITSKIVVMDPQKITQYKYFVIGQNTKSRASLIYDELLGSKTESLWVYLVKSSINKSGKSVRFSQNTCENSAISFLSKATDGSRLRRALNYSKTESELPSKTCTLLGQIASQLRLVDKKMDTPAATCEKSKNARLLACSDIKGSIRAIDKILSDLEQRESDSSEDEVKIKAGACLLFASDMLNYGNEGPLNDWPDNESASRAGSKDATALLPDGLPRLSKGVVVYMPNAGTAPIPNGKSTGMTTRRSQEIITYWTSFFDAIGATVKDGTAENNCIGKEFSK